MKEEIIREYIKQAIDRISHMEQLILGLATLGFIGWGFLHATPVKFKTKQESADSFDYGKQLFTIIFSGMIASAFNSLFIGRMAINASLLVLEEELQKLVHLPREALLYQDFFRQTSEMDVRAVYYACAAFLPMMSIASLIYVLFQAKAANVGMFEHNSRTTSKKPVRIVFKALWIISVLMTVGMTVINFQSIEKLISLAYNILVRTPI